MFRHNCLLRRIFSAAPSRPTRPLIAEPATSLTDLALAGQTLAYADRLRRGRERAEKSAALWALAMAAAGVAALAGALTHALYEDQAPRVRNAAWKTVGLSTAAASGFMLAAGIAGAVRPAHRAPYLVAAVLKTLLSATAAWRTGNFLFTIVDYTASMLVVLWFQMRNWRSSAAAPWVTGGILVSFIAAAIQQSNISLHRRFNHNDLYHVVQMGAFHLLYLGARRQQDDIGADR
jgi:hypothetical protein